MDGTEKTLVKKRGQITGPSRILIEILSALDDFGIDTGQILEDISRPVFIVLP